METDQHGKAPEILLNKEYSYAVDYWALGVVLFELLCRMVPWGASRDPFRISQAIMSLNIAWPKTKVDKDSPIDGHLWEQTVLQFNS